MIPRVSTRSVRTSSEEEFARYEFKFLLSQDKREWLEDEVAHFMRIDGHTHRELENSYVVRSLYYENLQTTHYYEKIDGIRVRQKFRIRTYDRAPAKSLPIYLEEKGRFVERTYKRRITITDSDLELFFNPVRNFELLEHFPGVDLIERFVYSTARKNVRPVVLIDYVRRPYVSNFDMNFRITFDGDLRAKRCDQLFPDGANPWYMCNAGFTIVEVKFHRRIPAWFHRILQTHNLTRLSLSKFCRGMERCGLAIDLS